MTIHVSVMVDLRFPASVCLWSDSDEKLTSDDNNNNSNNNDNNNNNNNNNNTYISCTFNVAQKCLSPTCTFQLSKTWLLSKVCSV